MARSGVSATLAVTNVDEKKRRKRRQACSCLLNVHDSLKLISMRIRQKVMEHLCSMCQTCKANTLHSG